MDKLLVFPHSHFCERARWALDHKKVSYQALSLVPGIHALTVKRKGCKHTTVPVWLRKDRAFQGFDEIVEHLEQTHRDSSLTPSTADGRAFAKKIESKFDLTLGENIRTILYSTLLDHPKFIFDCFSHQMKPLAKVSLKLLMPMLQKKLHERYVRSESYVDEARAAFDKGIAELSDMVRDQKYLIGDRFSRSDISLASLLSLIARPKEHPFPWHTRRVPCSKARAFLEAQKDTDALRWASDIYRHHRSP